MKRPTLLALALTTALHAGPLGDHAIFDTTPPPPPVNPRVAAPLAVGLELGVNSLAGLLGARGTWYPWKQVAVDGGIAWGTGGYRAGAGARVFTSGKFSSPFVGLAWKRSSGIDSASLDDGKSKKSWVQLNPVQYLDAEVGYEFRNTEGFVLVFTTGWSTALTSEKDRYTVKSGDLSESAKTARDLWTGSGPILAVAAGIGF